MTNVTQLTNVLIVKDEGTEIVEGTVTKVQKRQFKVTSKDSRGHGGDYVFSNDANKWASPAYFTTTGKWNVYRCYDAADREAVEQIVADRIARREEKHRAETERRAAIAEREAQEVAAVQEVLGGMSGVCMRTRMIDVDGDDIQRVVDLPAVEGDTRRGKYRRVTLRIWSETEFDGRKIREAAYTFQDQGKPSSFGSCSGYRFTNGETDEQILWRVLADAHSKW